MTAAMAHPLPSFRATRAGTCDSDYECSGIEPGDRVCVTHAFGGPLTVCPRSPPTRQLAAEQLVTVVDGAPATLAEALEQLTTHHEQHGHYDDEHVAALLAHIDSAAEQVAAHERETWSWRIRMAARQTSSITPEAKAGMHRAAHLIEQNRRQP